MKAIYLPKTERFIGSLNPVLKNKIMIMVDMLEECGHQLKMPFSKSLGGGLFELRIVGVENIRVFYCFHNDTIYLLHGIIKKTRKIQKKDIDLAKRMKRIVEST